MALTLRTTKGQPLTYLELDGNFTYLSSSFVASDLTSSMTVKYANTASFILGSNVYGPFGSNSILSSSYAQTASYALNAPEYLSGPGITIDTSNYISASVLTVNGVTPINGNITTALTATLTGPSASLVSTSSGDPTASLKDGTVWIVSNDPTTSNNGLTYIWSSGSLQWYFIPKLDQTAGDARYLQLGGGTMTGGITGSAGISLLGTSSYAETASFITSSNVYGPYGGDSVLSSSYALTASYAMNGGGGTVFPYTGSAIITGSLGITGSVDILGSLQQGTLETQINPVYTNALQFFGGYTDEYGYISITDYTSIISSNTGSIVLAGDFQGYTGITAPLTYTDLQISDGINTINVDPAYYSFPIIIDSMNYDGGSDTTTWFYQNTIPEIYAEIAVSNVQALGTGSHAEGRDTTALGIWSHAEGYGTIANTDYQHVTGKFNTNSSALFAIGNGSDDSNRSDVARFNQSSIELNQALVVSGSTIVSGSTTLNGVTNINGATIISSSLSPLTLIGSGSALSIFKVFGSQGELFSVTDSLSGSLFSVNDIYGLTVLEAFSDSTVHIGSYEAPSLHTTVYKTITTGSGTVIYQLPTASYNGAWFEYSAKSGSVVRVGQIMASWNGNSTTSLETTSSIGTTTALTMSVFFTGSFAALSGSATTNGWTVKTIIRSI